MAVGQEYLARALRVWTGVGKDQAFMHLQSREDGMKVFGNLTPGGPVVVMIPKEPLVATDLMEPPFTVEDILMLLQDTLNRLFPQLFSVSEDNQVEALVEVVIERSQIGTFARAKIIGRHATALMVVGEYNVAMTAIQRNRAPLPRLH
jgi:hypothetical protein